MTRRTYSWNAYEAGLAAGVDAVTGSITVESAAGLTAPAYLVIDPESQTLREYVKVTNIAGAVLTVTRGLGGSIGGTGQAHSAGAKVRAVPVHQWLNDIFDDIEDNAAAISGKYDISAHTKAAHDALNIDADTLDGLDSTYFASQSDLDTKTSKAYIEGLDIDAATLNGRVLDATYEGEFDAGLGPALPEDGGPSIIRTLDLSGEPVGSQWLVFWHARIVSGNITPVIISPSARNGTFLVLDEAVQRVAAWSKNTYGQYVSMNGSVLWTVGSGNPDVGYEDDTFNIRVSTSVFDEAGDGGIHWHAWFTAIRVS